MKQPECDVLLVFENLFKASEKGLLPVHVFDEALAIYKELVVVRDNLHNIETSFPVAQLKSKNEFIKEKILL